MKPKAIWKTLLTVFAAAVLLAAAALCAAAVPAKPGTVLPGESGACRSHTGSLVTLDKVPVRSGGKRAPSLDSVERDIPLVTIVVGFSNMAYSNSYNWSETIFSGEKSLSAYYTDMSFGKFTFTPAAETSAYGVGGNTNTADAQGDGVVHVKLSLQHKDWANEDEYQALGEALVAAIGQTDNYVDFASFDVDGNGRISENELAVGFVIAGYEASGNEDGYSKGIEKYFWSHAWSIREIKQEYASSLTVPTPDGTEVNAYIAIAENLDDDNDQEPISVLAHELGHYLGLPDLYDTKYNTEAAWGKYGVLYVSVMADGCWGIDPEGSYIPYSMDLWSRWALGWCTPQIADSDGDYTVAAQNYTQEDDFAAVYLPTQRTGEYYLLENRQFTKWDEGLAQDYEGSSGGIVLWHIDDAVFEQYNETNEVNDTFHRPAVMPLYPEKLNSRYTFIGNTTSVEKTKPFYSKSIWNAMFGQNTPLNLPLYGQGSDADNRAARSLSGLKLSFLDDSAASMTVRLSTADHVHFLSAVDVVDPTCTVPGMEAHFACDYCGAMFADADGNTAADAETLMIPALGHSFIHYAYNNDATCTADGTETAVCDHGCGESDTRTKAGTKLGHSFTDYAYNNDATCTADGTETAVCDHGCGESDTRTKAGTKLGHSFTDYVYNNDATCTADGSETAVCDRGCGETDTRTATGTKLGHSFTDYAYNNDATCTADGSETAVCDRGCGETDTRTAAGTKLPHTYGEPVWRWANDYGSATATFTCACGDTKTVTASAPAKTQVSAATATADQVVTYTASVTFAGRTYTQTTNPVSVPGTATGATEQPPQSDNLCPWDDTDHGNSFSGRLIRFFHGILYFFAHLFGAK